MPSQIESNYQRKPCKRCKCRKCKTMQRKFKQHIRRAKWIKHLIDEKINNTSDISSNNSTL